MKEITFKKFRRFPCYTVFLLGSGQGKIFKDVNGWRPDERLIQNHLDFEPTKTIGEAKLQVEMKHRRNCWENI